MTARVPASPQALRVHLAAVQRAARELADAAAEMAAAFGLSENAGDRAATPCAHPPRALRYLGLLATTGGPDPAHVAECTVPGCDTVVVLGAMGAGAADPAADVAAHDRR